jgi:DNA mismatch repair protein MutS
MRRRRADAVCDALSRADHAGGTKLPRVRNLRVGVKEAAGGIVFLHTIEPGAASKSYGIEVAKLAGLPSVVIERAKRVLKQHEKQERQSVQVETAAPLQLTMFTPLSQRIVDRH